MMRVTFSSRPFGQIKPPSARFSHYNPTADIVEEDKFDVPAHSDEPPEIAARAKGIMVTGWEQQDAAETDN